jgi:transposase-like protein
MSCQFKATNVNRKSPTKFVCKYCEYSTSIKYSFSKHLLTAKHKKATFVNRKSPTKVIQKFVCELCDYSSSNSRDYTKHLSTTKHKVLIESRTLPKKRMRCNELFL